MPRLLIVTILVRLVVTQGTLLGNGDEGSLIRGINALYRNNNCRLTVRKILDGDTDRGMEAALYDCGNGVERIDVTLGLSRKDLLFRYILRRGRVAGVELSERKYSSTADGGLNFDRPLPSQKIAVLYFDGSEVVSTIAGEPLKITEKNKNAKAAAFVTLLNAVRAALASNNPHPEFESISFLTGIFGNG